MKLENLKIAVIGLGYVGLSNAMLFALKHEVIALDIDETRVQLLQQRKAPIQDELIELYLAKDIDFQATLDCQLVVLSELRGELDHIFCLAHFFKSANSSSRSV